MDHMSEEINNIKIVFPIKMATPTIHLGVANKVMEKLEKKVTSLYLLGSISPDAVLNRHDVTKEDKIQSHLRDDGVKESWNKAIEMYLSNTTDKFLQGYSIHVMTDVLWITGVYKKVQKDIGDDFEREVFLNDLHFIERWLFRRDENRKMWNAVSKTKVNSMNYFVSPSEIEVNKLEKLQMIKHTKSIENTHYFNILEALDFADKASSRIAREIMKQSVIDR